MSPLGRFLLRNCDNDLRIDLRADSPAYRLLRQAGWHYYQARTVATMIGVSLVGGS